jgi:hypothetical protein
MRPHFYTNEAPSAGREARTFDAWARDGAGAFR